MASLLRKIVAGPRSRHPEADLDLCYVTDDIIATSGPSSTYPQLAYRNPLEDLVKFLDRKHKDNWAIWEFRAEGTGYPDEEVYGRIRHYPWPDHHPPPFALIPPIMASMRNWLMEDKQRVVVVHCKAGKGRSGTVACSYLISECAWKPNEALARFTERRMRSGFGQGVSIPSQLRWVNYVDQWTQTGKKYVERQVEVTEVHVWGLRDGVKVSVEGYVEQGRIIQTFHVFSRDERIFTKSATSIPEPAKVELKREESKDEDSNKAPPRSSLGPPKSLPRAHSATSLASNTIPLDPGGEAVVFKPSTRIILPSNDINIDFERRNKAAYGWTMVTSVAHVWFNAFFEGQRAASPTTTTTTTTTTTASERAIPANSGVFEIEWDKMDGLKGSVQKGTRALDRLAVVWKVHEDGPVRDVSIPEPAPGEEVAQMPAADWKGGDELRREKEDRELGGRTESPAGVRVREAESEAEHKVEAEAEREGATGRDGEGEGKWIEGKTDDQPETKTQPEPRQQEARIADELTATPDVLTPPTKPSTPALPPS